MEAFTKPAGPADLIASVDELASFPDIAYRIEELLEDPRADARDFGGLIEGDVALSAMLLRIANSALYGQVNPVDSIERAVAVIGLRPVRDLAYGMSARQTFEGISNDLVSVSDFWRHSLYCAAAARALAEHAGVCRGQSTFTMGMLHDIGQLVMFHKEPDLSRRALELSIEHFDGRETYPAEREVFGFDHTQVGSELGLIWNLPDAIRACLEFHHNPLEAPHEHLQAVKVVHAANSIAVLAEFETTDLSDTAPIEPSIAAELRIDEAFVADAIPQIRATADDLLRVLVG